MKELIERLRRLEQFAGGIVWEAADSLELLSYSYEQERNVSNSQAKEIERLTKALDFWKNGHMEMTKELFDVKLANDTAVDEYTKSEEKVIALTAERNNARDAWHRAADERDGLIEQMADQGPYINTLRDKNKELAADAALWRAYQSRKQAAINAGMAKNPLREGEQHE